MATTAGALSKVSVGRNSASLSSAAASGGTAPYTYQWYRSTVQGFTPGPSNIIDGATSLTLDDSGLEPGTTYYYVVKATDDGAVSDDSAELTVTTASALPEQNQFAQSALLGQLTLGQQPGTFSAQIADSEDGELVGGQAVKIVDDANDIPQVVACDADDDDVFGFINYNAKNNIYVAGDRCEISQSGNVLYLQATGPIARGERVCLDTIYAGGVQAIGSASSGDRVVGYAYDKASVAKLIRVKLGERFIVKA